MATKSEIERIAIVETEVKNLRKDVCDVKESVDSMNTKLDTALLTKADKSEVDRLDSRFWQIITGLVFLALGVIFAIFKK